MIGTRTYHWKNPRHRKAIRHSLPMPKAFQSWGTSVANHVTLRLVGLLVGLLVCWLVGWLVVGSLPKTNSSPLKIGRAPKGNDRLPTSNHPFSGAFAVSFREGIFKTGIVRLPTQYNALNYKGNVSKNITHLHCLILPKIGNFSWSLLKPPGPAYSFANLDCFSLGS